MNRTFLSLIRIKSTTISTLAHKTCRELLNTFLLIEKRCTILLNTIVADVWAVLKTFLDFQIRFFVNNIFGLDKSEESWEAFNPLKCISIYLRGT